MLQNKKNPVIIGGGVLLLSWSKEFVPVHVNHVIG